MRLNAERESEQEIEVSEVEILCEPLLWTERLDLKYAFRKSPWMKNYPHGNLRNKKSTKDIICHISSKLMQTRFRH